MNYKMMGRFHALILAILAFFMIPALIISLVGGTAKTTMAFAASMALTAAVAVLLARISRGAKRDFYIREGLICVGSSWIVISFFGCLPFWLSGEIPSFLDALFEMVSGFTTTGASVIANVEGLSRGVLYWRSFSHWLGGMGVLVFLLALLPPGGRNEGFTMHLFRAESPGPEVGKLVPSLRKTARVLYLTYIALTVSNLIFLLIGGMPLFDAICTAFGTAGTGGFGIKNDSLASYSPYLQNVTTVFMLLFGINFGCYYLLLLGKLKNVFRDEELRLYIGVVVCAVTLIAFNTRHLFSSLGETVRHAAFQVATIVTTTGFATTDFDLWPTFSKTVLVLLMVIGACAGSTGGGMKCSRVLLLLKNLKRNITRILQPSRVQVIRVNGKTVDEQVVSNTGAYLAAYVILLIASTLLLAIDGHSFETNFTAALAAMNNIGPGLDAVGPTCNYTVFSPLSKIVLILDMLAGRLEIFPILILFNPRAWRKK
ncbi:MAG: TrkH family potassium uptake protein [Clostridia bacterium]|nr:TrkH family potassium uptake protein [Clostridia bacterium]